MLEGPVRAIVVLAVACIGMYAAFIGAVWLFAILFLE